MNTERRYSIFWCYQCRQTISIQTRTPPLLEERFCPICVLDHLEDVDTADTSRSTSPDLCQGSPSSSSSPTTEHGAAGTTDPALLQDGEPRVTRSDVVAAFPRHRQSASRLTRIRRLNAALDSEATRAANPRGSNIPIMEINESSGSFERALRRFSGGGGSRRADPGGDDSPEATEAGHRASVEDEMPELYSVVDGGNQAPGVSCNEAMPVPAGVTEATGKLSEGAAGEEEDDLPSVSLARSTPGYPVTETGFSIQEPEEANEDELPGLTSDSEGGSSDNDIGENENEALDPESFESRFRRIEELFEWKASRLEARIRMPMEGVEEQMGSSSQEGNHVAARANEVMEGRAGREGRGRRQDLHFGVLENAAGGPVVVDFSHVQAMLDRLSDELAAGRRQGNPPASPAAIAALPVLLVQLEDVESGAACCVVCSDLAEVGEEVVRLPCRHLYHGACIRQWLEVRNTCPMCRFELPTDAEGYERRRRLIVSQEAQRQQEEHLEQV